MKTWLKITIPIAIDILILAFLGIFVVLVWDQSGWWFFAPLIASFVGGISSLFIWLIIKAKKVVDEKTRIDLKEAKEIYINYCKEDDDNPDNITIYQSKIFKVGERGKEPTPVAVLYGIGSEMNEKRVGVINLANPKKEIADLTNPSLDDIKEQVRYIADYPPEEPIVSKEIMKYDRFRQPIVEKTTTSPSQTKQEIEKKIVEEANKL